MEENHTGNKESNLARYNRERLKSHKLGIIHQSRITYPFEIENSTSQESKIKKLKQIIQLCYEIFLIQMKLAYGKSISKKLEKT